MGYDQTMFGRGAAASTCVFLWLSGCLEAPPGDDPADGDGGVDGGGCIQGDHPNEFDGPEACVPWGSTSDATATLSEDGALSIMLDDVAGEAYGGCYSYGLNALARGVTVEVSAVLEGEAAYTQVQAGEDGGPTDLTFMITLPMIYATTSSGTDHLEEYDPIAHRWLRIRSLGGQLLFEVSPDASEWTVFADPPDPPPELVRININAGTHDRATTSGEARFERVNTCP